MSDSPIDMTLHDIMGVTPGQQSPARGDAPQIPVMRRLSAPSSRAFDLPRHFAAEFLQTGDMHCVSDGENLHDPAKEFLIAVRHL